MKTLLTSLLITALVGFLLPGCANTQLIETYAQQRCEQFKNSGRRDRFYLAADLLTGYPAVRTPCSYDDELEYSREFVKRADAGEKPVAQIDDVKSLIETAGALVLLPVDKHKAATALLSDEQRRLLLEIMTALNQQTRGNE